MSAEMESDEVLNVVVNDEEQYSLWPAGRALPAGWREAGKSGTKEECLGFIREVWTDMRPLSLRRHMDAKRAEDSCPVRVDPQ